MLRAFGANAVAQPGGAVGEQGARFNQGHHFAQLGLGELKVGQALAKHGPCLRVVHRQRQRAARHAQGGSRHRGAKNIERAHGQLEAAMQFAQLRVCRDLALVKLQRGQRVRRHHSDVL